MKQVIGTLSTEIDTYNGRPQFGAYVQVWRGNGDGTADPPIIHKSYDNLTLAQWRRFRRIQDALAVLQVAS